MNDVEVVRHVREPRVLRILTPLLAGLCAVTLLLALVMIYLQGEKIEDQAKTNRAVVEELRLQQAAQDARTHQIVAAIQRGLQAHDANVRAYLKRINATTTCEKDCPSNRESVVVPVPKPVVIRIPAPSPQPAPKPCKRLPNGKCRK